MAGGVFAGVIGPQLVTHTMDLWQPYTFAATFLAQAAVAAVSALVLLGVRVPMPTAAEVAGGRPLAAIVRQPRFITAGPRIPEWTCAVHSNGNARTVSHEQCVDDLLSHNHGERKPSQE
jgi:hypothetical protein